MLLLSYPRNHHRAQCHENFLLSSVVSGLTFSSLIHLELIFVHDLRVQLQSFPCGYPVFPTLFVEEAVLSPLGGPFNYTHRSNTIGSFPVEDHLTIHIGVMELSLLFHPSHCLDYGYFVICFQSHLLIAHLYSFCVHLNLSV